MAIVAVNESPLVPPELPQITREGVIGQLDLSELEGC